jgi:N-acetylneuraminate synthase
MAAFSIGRTAIGDEHPTYFIADISANHDGELERARVLIRLAAEAGANAAKFQNFRAPRIVSKHGFEVLGAQLSHQAKWKKSVYQVYQEASLPFEWTPSLKEDCEKAGIEYFSTPYDFEAVEMLEPYVPAYKVGSGDITWLEMLRKVASKRKPVLLACGASDIGDVRRAMDLLLSVTSKIVLMQCNTNYTGSVANFDHIHLNVLRTFASMYPGVILGLSDHTPGHTTVLGAVALGARVVEKHFTDDRSRTGPDHAFSMTPESWAEMVARTRELERALGSGVKRVVENEKETAVVQRRCLRAARDLVAGEPLTRDSIDVLRPAPAGAIEPSEIDDVIGRRVRVAVPAGEHLRWTYLD